MICSSAARIFSIIMMLLRFIEFMMTRKIKKSSCLPVERSISKIIKSFPFARIWYPAVDNSLLLSWFASTRQHFLKQLKNSPLTIASATLRTVWLNQVSSWLHSTRLPFINSIQFYFWLDNSILRRQADWREY